MRKLLKSGGPGARLKNSERNVPHVHFNEMRLSLKRCSRAFCHVRFLAKGVSNRPLAPHPAMRQVLDQPLHFYS